MAGHPLPEWGQICPICDADAAAWAAQLANPPDALVIRTHDGKAAYYRIPKHLQRKRTLPIARKRR